MLQELMFVKLTSGFAGKPLVSRNLVLRKLWRTGTKSCKLEVTFAIHLTIIGLSMIELRAILISAIADFYDAMSEYKSLNDRGVDCVC